MPQTVTPKAKRASPPKAAPSKKANASTALRILDAAITLFSRNGYDGASTTEIALASGVAQSVVLYHFDSKDALWHAAMDRLFDRIHAEFRRDRDVLRDLSSVDRLKVWIRQLVVTSAAHPELGRVMMMEGTSGGARLQWLIKRHLGADYQLYETHFKRAMSEGRVKPLPAFPLTILVHAAATMLFTLSPLVEAVSGRSPMHKDTITAQADMVVDVLFNGFLK
ncbi:MAG: TetR family transcriptional regulator [Rhodospirillaceae bacterium]|nr:TetR family transcriptional regulator [Rhodospirillaceae bacterium]